MTEKRKAEKRKPIKTRGKTEVDKRNVPPTSTANSDWFLLFRFPLFRQDVNPALGYFDEKVENEKAAAIKTLADNLQFRLFVLLTISASSDWPLLFCFLLFHQGVNAP